MDGWLYVRRIRAGPYGGSPWCHRGRYGSREIGNDSWVWTGYLGPLTP